MFERKYLCRLNLNFISIPTDLLSPQIFLKLVYKQLWKLSTLRIADNEFVYISKIFEIWSFIIGYLLYLSLHSYIVLNCIRITVFHVCICALFSLSLHNSLKVALREPKNVGVFI
jgi:hypothetical protein